MSLIDTYNKCFPDGWKAEDDVVIPSTPDQVWDWFGDHGAFIGGIPLDAKYVPECITDPDRTPFERLGYVGPDNILKTPFIVLRLREKAIRDGRLHDPMEIVFRRASIVTIGRREEE